MVLVAQVAAPGLEDVEGADLLEREAPTLRRSKRNRGAGPVPSPCLR